MPVKDPAASKATSPYQCLEASTGDGHSRLGFPPGLLGLGIADYESGGQEFESLRARQQYQGLSCICLRPEFGCVRVVSAIAMERSVGARDQNNPMLRRCHQEGSTASTSSLMPELDG